jgi:hypothetical protein
VGGSSSTNQSQTTSTKKWTGANEQIANQMIGNIGKWFNTSNPAKGGADAWNNNTFSVAMNDLQKADYGRNANLMNNSQLNMIAGGGNLDPNTNPYFQKNLDAKVKTFQDAFGTALDSTRGGFQKAGIGDSSMRANKETKMLKAQSTGLDEFVNNAYQSEYDKRVQEMLQANGLLSQAGLAGYRYNQAEQTGKDSSLANFAKLYGLDANQQSMMMQYLNTIAEPTQTTNGSSTTQKNPGIMDWAQLLF